MNMIPPVIIREVPVPPTAQLVIQAAINAKDTAVSEATTAKNEAQNAKVAAENAAGSATEAAGSATEAAGSAIEAAGSANSVISTCVRYDIQQLLTSAQQSQAITNISTINKITVNTDADIPVLNSFLNDCLIKVNASAKNGGYTTLYFFDFNTQTLNWLPMLGV